MCWSQSEAPIPHLCPLNAQLAAPVAKLPPAWCPHPLTPCRSPNPGMIAENTADTRTQWEGGVTRPGLGWHPLHPAGPSCTRRRSLRSRGSRA